MFDVSIIKRRAEEEEEEEKKQKTVSFKCPAVEPSLTMP